MYIGFSNGDFHQVWSSMEARFSPQIMDKLRVGGKANALELHCRDEESLDYLLQTNVDVAGFEYISLHAPDFPYGDTSETERILRKLDTLHRKYAIKNFVFHTDKVQSWDTVATFAHLPISIENMDDRKVFGRTIADVDSILSKYPFGLTLDLQHCYVNDSSMQLAEDFQTHFKDRIVQYHISGYAEPLLHVPLTETQQDSIITSLQYPTLPIIIESVFEEYGQEIQEFKYIQEKMGLLKK